MPYKRGKNKYSPLFAVFIIVFITANLMYAILYLSSDKEVYPSPRTSLSKTSTQGAVAAPPANPINPSQDTWKKFFDEPSHASAVEETFDSQGKSTGYIYAGGEGGFHLRKLDKKGNEVWYKTYGAINELGLQAVEQVFDSLGNPDGYVVAGTTAFKGSGTTNDAYLARVDNSGSLIWEKIIDVSNSGDIAYDMHITSDGGFIIGGEAGLPNFMQGMAAIKTDSSGNVLWKNYYLDASTAKDIEQASDGGFALAGRGNGDAALLRLDSQGNKVWYREYGSLNYVENIWKMIETSNGEFLLVGDVYIDVINQDIDVYLIKTDSNGNKIWEKTYGIPGDFNVDSANSISETSDGGYIITGESGNSLINNLDIYLLKIDSQGNILWEGYIDGKSYWDRGIDIIQTSDGGYLAGGLYGLSGPPWGGSIIVKTDSMGKVV